MKTLRKLVLGETWVLPIGILVAVGTVAVVRLVAGPAGWWEEAGGWLLLVLLVAAFAAALRNPR